MCCNAGSLQRSLAFVFTFAFRKPLTASGVAISEERNYTSKFMPSARCCEFSSLLRFANQAPQPRPRLCARARALFAPVRLAPGFRCGEARYDGHPQAGVAKSVYARDLKSLLLTEMRVQVPPPAPWTRLPHSTVIRPNRHCTDRPALLRSPHEERDEDDDGNGHAQEPQKQRSHGALLEVRQGQNWSR